MFPCTVGARVGEHYHLCIYIYMNHIYKYTYVHEHTPQAKPGCCSGGRISCKQNNNALLSTNIKKNDDSKSLNYCALLGSIGAGMDILGLLLAVTIVAFVVQLNSNVTMIATVMLLIII